MEAEEAGAACDRILAEGNLSQVVVSSGDLNARLRQWVERGQISPSAPGPVTLHQRPNLTTSYVAPCGELEMELAEIWQELFGITPIGRDDNFFELGGHSLLATQLSARLYAKLQVEISLATLLQARTIAELAVAVVSVQAADADPAALEGILAEIGQLSPSEIQHLLNEQEINQDTVGDDDGIS
jgi:acyl carrier protein